MTVGALLGATVILTVCAALLKEPSDAVNDTVYTPAAAADQSNTPAAVKVAPAGSPDAAKVSVSPSASLPETVKRTAWPARTDWSGIAANTGTVLERRLTVAEAEAPVTSEAVNRKLRAPPGDGAVKLAEVVVAPDSVTTGPDNCCQE